MRVLSIRILKLRKKTAEKNFGGWFFYSDNPILSFNASCNNAEKLIFIFSRRCQRIACYNPFSAQARQYLLAIISPT
jgi:hypothetical protein